MLSLTLLAKTLLYYFDWIFSSQPFSFL